MTKTRRTAREWAVQMLTAADLNPPADVGEFIKGFWEELEILDGEEEGAIKGAKGTLRTFAEDRVRGVLENKEKIDSILSGMLDNWDLARLGTIERAVLRLGIWEMDFSDVPKAVVINEAIDLANWFGSPKSRPLVNGILDKYGKHLTAAKKCSQD